MGVTFALAASPCSTPVLVSLLGYVSASGSNPAAGAGLLLAYSAGCVAPDVGLLVFSYGQPAGLRVGVGLAWAACGVCGTTCFAFSLSARPFGAEGSSRH